MIEILSTHASQAYDRFCHHWWMACEDALRDGCEIPGIAPYRVAENVIFDRLLLGSIEEAGREWGHEFFIEIQYDGGISVLALPKVGFGRREWLVSQDGLRLKEIDITPGLQVRSHEWTGDDVLSVEVPAFGWLP